MPFSTPIPYTGNGPKQAAQREGWTAGPRRGQGLVGGFGPRVRLVSLQRASRVYGEPFGHCQGDSDEVRIRPFRTSRAAPT